MISILSDEDLIMSAGDDLAIESQIKQLNLFDEETEISIKDGRFFATFVSNINEMRIESKQAWDFLLQYCDGIIWKATTSLFNIAVHVDVDFEKLPKIFTQDSRNSFGVNIYVKCNEPIKLHNISDDVFGLTAGNISQLGVYGRKMTTKIDLTGLRWWKHSARFANVTLCNIDEKSFGTSTDVSIAENCLPGPNIPNKLKERILRNMMYSVPRTADFHCKDNTIELDGATSWCCKYHTNFKKDLSISKIKCVGEDTWMDIDPINAEICDGFDLIELRCGDHLDFNNKRYNNSNKQYVIGGHSWTKIKAFNGLCNTSTDEFITAAKDARNHSFLQICFPVCVKDWNTIKCNCMSLILSDSHTEVRDIYRLFGDSWGEIDSQDLNNIIPLKNFPNLQYIIWSSIGYKGIYKTDDKWKLF